jgi:hypothetical protein
MPNTDKMKWPYPDKDTDPWFEKFASMTEAMDASGYAAREDRNIIFGGGGNVTWDAGSSTLSWASDIVAFSMIAGFKLSIPAGSIFLTDSNVLYADLVRSPVDNSAIGIVSASSSPNTNNSIALAIRSGSTVYWRWGSKIESGETLNMFGVPGTGVSSDFYERSATFGVPIGNSIDEATLGRILVPGTLLGLSAEITLPVAAGTVTVNVKVNGVVKLSVALSALDPSVKQTVVAPGLHPLVPADQISVEVIGASYLNVGSLPAGLTVNAVIGAGIQLPIAGLPDSSVTGKGITRLSVAPAIPTIPIAVGDNDTRVSQNRRILYTVAQPANGSNFNVTFSPSMPSTSYIVTYCLGTVAAHVTLNIPVGGRSISQFNVVTNTALQNGETIYFHVVQI